MVKNTASIYKDVTDTSWILSRVKSVLIHVGREREANLNNCMIYAETGSVHTCFRSPDINLMFDQTSYLGL